MTKDRLNDITVVGAVSNRLQRKILAVCFVGPLFADGDATAFLLLRVVLTATDCHRCREQHEAGSLLLTFDRLAWQLAPPRTAQP